MKYNSGLACSILAIGIIAGASGGIAQTTADPHHPQGSPGTAAQTAPPKQMQSGQGMGMMGGDMMGKMMQGGGMSEMMGKMMQGGGMSGMMGDCPMMGMKMGADTSTFAEGRVAFLKAELAITDAQKGVWDAYAAALKKNLQGMQAMRQTMMKMMEAKTPVDRLDAHVAAMDARIASLKEVKPALAALHAALSDEQKKKADQILTGMGCMM